MPVLLKKNTSNFPNMLTDLLDSERFAGKNFLNMDEDFLPYESLLKVPSVNVTERDSDYLIEVAAPGLDKKDFKVVLDHDVLSVSAEKKVQKEESDKGITRKEFSYENFCRTFRLPENSKIDKLKAKYENGILNIEIPKKEVRVVKPKKEIDVV